MTPFAQLDATARGEDFSGVIRIERAGEVAFSQAYGLANRALAVPNSDDTVFALASGTKAFTALAVLCLVHDGVLSLQIRARELLASDLPVINDAVTVEMLLAHRSGFGDYLDEAADWDVNDHVLSVPVHTLADTQSFLAIVGGYPQVFAPGERLAYCNGGFIVLALLAERAASIPFHDIVKHRVCRPARLTDTAFLRSAQLPGRAALGYLAAEGNHSNVLHMPVRGTGDGGIYSTAADLSRRWTALFAGQIVHLPTVALMTAPRSDVPSESYCYGLGLWLHATGPAVLLEGFDPGISTRSTHDPTTGLTVTGAGQHLQRS